MAGVFVVNAGSSSLKYRLLDPASGEVALSGTVERIGEAGGDAPDMAGAMRLALDALPADAALDAVGHRVVHGGSLFDRAVLIDDEVERAIDALSELAPLHNPANLAGIRAAREALPGVPEVAVFDTAFHQTMPPEAWRYALDRDLADRHGVRRYGFHGTSHRYVSRRAAEFLGRPLGELRQITLHLGNGASACAIDGGVSVDTSMGLTPLEGLVMGTRSGDLDPAILPHLGRTSGLDLDELDRVLNKNSGLLGLAGSGDVRDVQRLADAGDAHAEEALAVTAHRIRHYVGAYLAILGGADAIVFTAGVGENSPGIRERSLRGLEGLGIRLDPERNRAADRGERRISADGSAIEVLVISTDEEREIAAQAVALL